MEDLSNVRIETFGGLKVLIDGSDVALGSARRQLVLARLVVARGRSVSLPNLIDTLWPDAPPASAANQVHRYVGELRRSFERSLKPREIGTVLLPSANGYRIAVDRVESDLDEFYLLIDSAGLGSRPESGVHDIDVLRRALGMSLLRSFADLPDEITRRPEFAVIERDRIRLAIAAADASLEENRDFALLPLLETVAGTAELDEPLQERIIRLLLAAGRRGEALQQYEATRRRLAEELGVDPGAGLKAAYQSALRDDSATVPPVADTGRYSRTLPPTMAGFVSRESTSSAFNDLENVLASRAVGTAVITGMAGVGKTTLAVSWAHALASHFPDGQLFVNLRGFDASEGVESAESARDFLLESMGENLAAIGDSSLARQARYRHLLDSSRLLVILDNVRDSDHVRPLLAGASASFTLVTSRNQLSSLVVREGAASYSLSRWSDDESLHLLIGRLGASRAALEEAALKAISATCAGLPLALAIIAARAAMQPLVSLGQVVTEMRNSTNPLDSLKTDDANDDLSAVFAWSYRHLSDRAARVFRQASTYPGMQISINAAASITGISTSDLQPVLRELYAANMLESITGERFVIHDLLRAFAGDLLSAVERSEAEVQLLGHYVRSTRNISTTAGVLPNIELPPPPALPLSPDAYETMDEWGIWYQCERDPLRAALDVAWANSRWLEYASIVTGMRAISSKFDTYESTLSYSTKGLEAAESSGSLVLVAECCRDVGFRQSMAGFPDLAKQLMDRALTLFGIVGNDWGRAMCYRQLSSIAHRSGETVAQIEYAEKSMEIARNLPETGVLGGAYAMLAEAYNTAQRWDDTIALLRDGKAACSAPVFRPSFSAEAAQALNKRGRYKEALAMTTWGLESGDPESLWMLGNLIERAVAAAELELWDEVRVAGDHYSNMLAKNAALLREHNNGELDEFTNRIRMVVARIPAAGTPGVSDADA